MKKHNANFQEIPLIKEIHYGRNAVIYDGVNHVIVIWKIENDIANLVFVQIIRNLRCVKTHNNLRTFDFHLDRIEP